MYIWENSSPTLQNDLENSLLVSETDGLFFRFWPQMGLLSEDYGKHLLGVEDLLQKHSLVEADIAAQADRVQSVNEQAEVFLHQDNEEDGIENYILTI